MLFSAGPVAGGGRRRRGRGLGRRGRGLGGRRAAGAMPSVPSAAPWSARTTCTGASASDVSPRNIASTACMFSPSMRGLEHGVAADRRVPTASIWYVGIASGSTSLSTPANSISLAGVRLVVGDDVAAGRRADQPAGDARVERSPWRARSASVRRRKSCWREMRPRSGRAVGLPVAAARRVLVLVVARPHVGQRVVAVEREAARSSGTLRPVLGSRAGYSNGTVTPPTASTSVLNVQKSTWM